LDTLPKENVMLEDDHPDKFIANMGAEGLYELLRRLDLDTCHISSS
jgi:DNA-directed RNA polymerase subunit beta'